MEIKRYFSLAGVLGVVLFGTYLYFFFESLPRWFHPGWTTDDAMQQVFPFHAVFDPDIFAGDYIAEVMKGYLAPGHYWLGYLMTWLLGDLIMASHWIMFIQLALACAGLFLAVKHAAGVFPAFFAITWLLHSRVIIQRSTGGLPRGWALPLLCIFLYFFIRKNHIGVLVTLFVGCFFHPPATFLAAVCYGLWLLWGTLRKSTRPQFIRPLYALLLFGPVLAFTTLMIIKRPEHVGQMATLEQAQELPHFQRPHGRFPFLPLPTWERDLRIFGFQTFISRLHRPADFWREHTRKIVLALFLTFLLIGLVRRRTVVPSQLWFFFFSIFGVYWASRILAFKLYVPDRHLQIPLAVFCIAAFTIAIWRAFASADVSFGAARSSAVNRFSELRHTRWSFVGLIALGLMLYQTAGTGLYGDANFNTSSTRRGAVFQWIEENTPRDSLVAGHPTFIDDVMLFGKRRGFATTETYHPFYLGYLHEIDRRIDISLRAHYARDLTELYELLEPEGIDYFVFERRRFYPAILKDPRTFYFEPFRTLSEELGSRPWQEYAYREIPAEMDLEGHPYKVFRDHRSVLVDVAQLGEYLRHRS